MKSIRHILHQTLTSFAIILNFLRPHSDQSSRNMERAFLEEPLSDQEIKKQRKELRSRRKPLKLREIRKRYLSKLHYVSSKSRNVRDLDQRKIRRKNINC